VPTIFVSFFFFCETTVKDHMADILCVCVELPQREKEKEQKRKWTVSFWGVFCRFLFWVGWWWSAATTSHVK
jgi:hypothetical protein